MHKNPSNDNKVLEYKNKAHIKVWKTNEKIRTFLKVWNFEMSIKNALEYENKEQKEIKRRKAKEMTTIGETGQTLTALHEYSHPVFFSFILISS